MSKLSELLEEAAGPIDASVDVERLVSAATRRRLWRLRQRAALAAVIVVILVASVAFGVTRGSGRSSRVTTIPPTPGVFAEATNVALILDDGYDGVTVVDLDRRVAVRRPLTGQAAGDQPFRLGEVGGSLIVGWGDVYAVPLDGTPARHLGAATIWLPAAETGRVWLVDYPGGRVGSGTPTFSEVDTAGVVYRRVTPSPVLGVPEIGVPGGLAFQSGTGLTLWDATTGRVTGHLGAGTGFVSDIHGNELAWCEGACDTLHITHFGGRDLTVSAPPDASSFEAGFGRFSPDGRYLAIDAAGGGPSHPGSPPGDVVIVDTLTGATQTIAPHRVAPFSTLEWAPDSQTLFIAGNSYEQADTTISRYEVATRRLETVTVPVAGLLGGIAVEESVAQPLLRAPVGDLQACPPPAVYPSRRTGACGFHF